MTIRAGQYALGVEPGQRRGWGVGQELSTKHFLWLSVLTGALSMSP